MQYEIIFDKKASKFIKKLEKNKKEIFKNEIINISFNPYQNEQLKGILKGIYSHHLKIINVEYRIAYTIYEIEKRIAILYISTRENFYRELERKIR